MTDAEARPAPVPDSFPRQQARTRRFSLGEPRGFRIGKGEDRLLFLRSDGGSDPVQKLWAVERFDDETWRERLLVDPLDLLDAGHSGHSGHSDDLPPAERARRERLREQANGITAFDADTEATTAVFAVAGSLHIVDTHSAQVRKLAAGTGAYDPRISPDASMVAYVADRGLRSIATAAGAVAQSVIGDEDEQVTWGVADFIAAEELDRYRGFWWSPDSKRLLTARVDETPVNTWWIADPSNPQVAPRSHRYPAAGTANAVVTLAFFDVETRRRTDIERTGNGAWPLEGWPYLVHATWNESGCTIVVMNREQTIQRSVDVCPTTGALRTLHEATDDTWVELCPGAPARLADDRIVITVEAHTNDLAARPVPAATPDDTEPGEPGEPGEPDDPDDPEQTRTLVLREANGTLRALTPCNMQVRRVVHVDARRAIVAVTASRPLRKPFTHLNMADDTGATHLVQVPLDGSAISLLAGGPDAGLHDMAAVSGETAVIRSASVNRTRAEFRLVVSGTTKVMLRNHAEVALVNPKPKFFRVGPRAIPCALFLPASPTVDPLPVLLDPYGGPHAQRVVRSRNAHTTSQWFADQGFAVLVVDGRGTPGPGPRYEKAVHNDFTVGVVEDQVTGLLEAVRRFPQLDLSRVAIRGWSFGGFLAAMAVLDRPDLFHAAVVGAPVTEWRLYDTGYTERYLGNPNTNQAIYDANSVVAKANRLTRPMMLIHGLADDNVVCAHTLQLSSALLAHGKPHEVLPLSNVTHMTPQEEVAENLLRLQVEFLRRSLNLPR